jgi:hypothetical protein
MRVQGWYQDPYGVHAQRWVSNGQPTALVRDGGVESYDPPAAAGPPGPAHAWQPVPDDWDQWHEIPDEPEPDRMTARSALILFLAVFLVLFLVFGLYVIIGIQSR